MEPPEPTSEQSDSNFDYLVDLNKDSDSIRELQSSLMRRTEPAVKQKLQDLCYPKFKKMAFYQQIMIAIVAIYSEAYVPLFEIIEDIRSNPWNLVHLGYMVLYALLYEFVLTLVACPHWYPLWLMRFIRIVTPLYTPLSLWITLRCYRSGYKQLATAMAGCLVGHLHGQVKIPGRKSHEATLEAVKNIYQEAYDQMKEDSTNALDEAYALLRKETTAFCQEKNDLWEERLKEKQHYIDESAKGLKRMKKYQDNVIETKRKHIETMERLNEVLREGNEKTRLEQEEQQRELEEKRADPWATQIRWRSRRDAYGKKERR